MEQTCLQRLDKIFYITELMAAICGVNVLNPDFKFSVHTWAVIFAINAYYAGTIYTIYIGFVVYKDWKIPMQSLCLAGAGVQGYVKFLTGVSKRTILISLKRKLTRIYEEYQQDEDFLPILKYRIHLTEKVQKIFMVVYVITVVVLIGYPLIHNMLTNDKIMIMQFYLPGIDRHTDAGHLTHIVVHGLLVFLGGFGNFAYDMFIVIFIIHLPLIKDLLKVKSKKLNKTLLETNNPNKTMPMLKDIAEWHQYYNEYAEKVNKSYYWIILVEILSSVIGISSTLFAIVIRSWPAALAYLIYSFLMLYSYCGLGHLIELSNDEVIDLFYGDLLWYDISLPEKKFVLLMLRKSQAPITLTVGQVMPLSMGTALQATKAIYSYLMMLVNFLNTGEM